MNFIKTEFPGLMVVEPDVFGDHRGYFFESYNQKAFAEAGIHAVFKQDNQSSSRRKVIRGLHFQRNPYAQSKLVRVVEGEIFDIALDIRKGSPTYGQWFGVNLSAENKKQLYIPAGFAHGFSVLSEQAVVHYKADQFYHPEAEGGILFNDSDLKVEWKIAHHEAIVSKKDLMLPTLARIQNDFEYHAENV